MNKKNSFSHLMHSLQQIFISGLVALLPLTLTIALLTFCFHMIKSWLQPIVRYEPDIFRAIPHSEIILILIFIFLVGILVRFLLLQQFITAFEHLLGKIPLLRQLYFGIKQLVHALGAQDKFSFQQVVIIEFPRDGIFSLGFVTGELSPGLSPDAAESFNNVFVPTTPNPTTGFYIMVPKGKCKITNLTRQEAMALIISGGIIQPEHIG
jgi:uncharacterized membrane protein